jgi:hypothetical protein
MVVRRRPIDMILFCRLRDAAFNIAPAPRVPSTVFSPSARISSSGAIYCVTHQAWHCWASSWDHRGDHPTQNTSWDGQRKGEGRLHEEEKTSAVKRVGVDDHVTGQERWRRERHESRERQDEARRGKKTHKVARRGKTKRTRSEWRNSVIARGHCHPPTERSQPSRGSPLPGGSPECASQAELGPFRISISPRLFRASARFPPVRPTDKCNIST